MIQFVCSVADIEELEHNRELLQSPPWAGLKAKYGWDSRAVKIEEASSGFLRTMLVLTRTIAFGQRLAYLPLAPSQNDIAQLMADHPDEQPGDILRSMAAAIRRVLDDCFVLRFDLPWPELYPDCGNHRRTMLPGLKKASADIQPSDCGNHRRTMLPGLKKASADIQPPHSVIINLKNTSEDELLAAMKTKTRYNIRLSAKKGVAIHRVPRKNGEIPAELARWYQLYKITEERNRIALHSYEYYAELFSQCGDDQLSLYVACHDGDLLAGIIVANWKGQGRYLYGASSNVKRNTMPAYGLQWKVMVDLLNAGANCYDLFGIPPSAEKGHPMYGLYQFKTGFGGQIVRHPGAWDIPLRPALYALYRMAERLRMYYFRVLRKRF